jgi:uncharacterized membrane protein
MEHSRPTPAERRELDRLAAFTDGVFAIAITLLVLNVDVPRVPGSDLGPAISHLSSAFVAYGIGFAVMGLFWYEHHKLSSSLARSNGRLVLANTVLLAVVALMPFTTAVLGRYDEPLAVAMFAANVGLATILTGLTKLIAIEDHLGSESPTDSPRHRRREVLAGTTSRVLVFLISIPIAYAISPSFAQWFWLLLVVVSVSERRRVKLRRMPHRTDAR